MIRCCGRAAMSVGAENGCNATVVYPCGGFCSFRQSMRGFHDLLTVQPSILHTFTFAACAAMYIMDKPDTLWR